MQFGGRGSGVGEASAAGQLDIDGGHMSVLLSLLARFRALVGLTTMHAIVTVCGAR